MNTSRPVAYATTAARLRSGVPVARPQAVIGRNTVAAMQSGIFWGYIGLIEGTVARIRAEFERPMATVATLPWARM